MRESGPDPELDPDSDLTPEHPLKYSSNMQHFSVVEIAVKTVPSIL
jgi:hypothetical protein